jgi:hypothetical protein
MYIAGHDRSQLLLLPEAVDDYVGSDNPVLIHSGTLSMPHRHWTDLHKPNSPAQKLTQDIKAD